MRLVERAIYLPDFDIDQNGNVGCLARRDAEKNLLTYVLFYDQVRLQSSAFLKVGGMYDIGLRRPELFAAAGGDTLVSMGIERSIECYESYAEGRFSVLTRESGERNPELRAYASNNAFERARFLDSLVGSNQIRRPKERVEDLFRSEVRRGARLRLGRLYREGRQADRLIFRRGRFLPNVRPGGAASRQRARRTRPEVRQSAEGVLLSGQRARFRRTRAYVALAAGEHEAVYDLCARRDGQRSAEARHVEHMRDQVQPRVPVPGGRLFQLGGASRVGVPLLAVPSGFPAEDLVQKG